MKLLVLALFAIVAGANACGDARADCANLRRYCKLVPYKKYMTKWCGRTCGFCGGPQPPTQGPPPPPTQGPGPDQGQCGMRQPSARVIAGKTAKRGDWPWQILMLYKGRASCGGTIVSSRWVVTAAHCVDGRERNAQSFTVRVGEHNRNQREGSEVTYQVERVVKYQGYNKRVMNNDIAMLKVNRPITFDKYVQPACLPSAEAQPGTECYITGWGKIRHPGSMTSVLQQGQMKVVGRTTCENLNRRTIPFPITPSMLCAGDGGRTRISGCHGDSGGPFVCKKGGKWELHGAVSHGSGSCSSYQSYTVFANVYTFKSWIQGNINT